MRPLGTGTQTGNGGSANGMLACSGSGCTDAGVWSLRLEDAPVSFQIGREKARSRCANDPLSAGFGPRPPWDGASPLHQQHPPPKAPNGTLIPSKSSLIGFANHVVGSLRMAVDECALFDRALPAPALAALSLNGAPLSDTLAEQVCALQMVALDSERAADFTRAAQKIASDTHASAAWRHWAALAVARRNADIAACVALVDDLSAPSHLRGMAVEALTQAARKGTELPSRVLVKLPEYLELDADDQRLFALALADAHAREGNVDAASPFSISLSSPDMLPIDAAEVRQRCAGSCGKPTASMPRATTMRLYATTRVCPRTSALSPHSVWRRRGAGRMSGAGRSRLP